MTESPRYARWKAPAEDGQALIWPEPRELLEGVRENQRLLAHADSSLLQGIPLSHVRKRFREQIYHPEDGIPIIATGHQAELHHSGVWVKNALIDALATALNGEAMHFAVDTDEPKHLILRWPGGSTSLIGQEQSKAAWSGVLHPPGREQIGAASLSFARASAPWDFKPVAPQFFDFLAETSPRWPSLPMALSDALHSLDESLGLNYRIEPVSPLFSTLLYLVFVHHILARAREFAHDYNQSLEELRREKRIRTAMRPMPNLAASDEIFEVPFWLDHRLRGTRERAHVRPSGNGFALEAGDRDRFTFDPNAEGWQAAAALQDWLKGHELQLTPRALTLTAVLRLLIADGFIHGIGGGEYDQVLDKLIARHWKMTPPRFAVTTATLFFPSAAHQSRACLPCLIAEGHHLRHNVLGDRKAQLVEAIASSPRGSHQRAALFASMHQQIRAEANHRSIRQWEARLEQARELAGAQREIFDRELFYAIQPQERLSAMIGQYRERIGRL